ncbi:MAG: Gfo/Idh/MocA family oxidoreductase [Ilumatobacteraceae bacterium]|nr:Gfo/Idh/MocA family oxidoreductase [Ilumatobacteraceae bacterium]
MTAGRPVGIGVIGARSVVATRAVLPAIARSPSTRLVAVASAGGPVPDPWRHLAVDGYDAVIEHPDVEAVYVPLHNDAHRPWVERIAAAGRHVLCEKPIAPSAADAEAMVAAARRSGVVLAEAWMTPFDPRWSRALELARTGRIGEVTEVVGTFTFTLPPSAGANYRWSPVHGGGALLDVGIYCLGPALELWGDEVESVSTDATWSASGVDATFAAEVRWLGGRVAHARCSFVEPEVQRLEYRGDQGTIVLASEAHTGGATAEAIEIVTPDGGSTEVRVDPGDPYERMIGAFAAAVRGRSEWPRPVERSVRMMRLLDSLLEAAR